MWPLAKARVSEGGDLAGVGAGAVARPRWWSGWRGDLPERAEPRVGTWIVQNGGRGRDAVRREFGELTRDVMKIFKKSIPFPNSRGR